MRKQKALSALIFWIVSAPVLAFTQDLPKKATDPCANPLNITQWVNCRVDAISAAQINQKGTSKQVEMPSIGTNTTSLVDQTEAPDVLGLALNLAGVKGSNGGSDNPAPIITTTAYAIYAGTAHHDPLDPAFYLRYAGLRRLSFSIGRDSADEKTDTQRAFIFGSKYLIINKRDASSLSNRDDLKAVSAAVAQATVGFAQIEDEVERYIYNQLKANLGYPKAGETEDDALIRFVNSELGSKVAATLGQLSLEQRGEIDKIITRKIYKAVRLKQTTLEAFERIRRRPQLSFSFQTKQRSEDGTDEYRSGLLFDVGVYQRLNFATNATFDYEDSKSIGGDKRGGRLAAEGYLHLNRDGNILGGKDPIVLAFGGEGKWMSSAKPVYTGQVKLTFPIFDGINIPVSFSVANRADLIKENKVRGNFGFTFDLAKLMKGLR